MKRALVLLLALGAAGCSGPGSSSSPTALPPISATPATTALAQPVPSDPEAARASAGEFARTWVETLNEAYGTLDTTALRAMSAPECVTCQAYIQAMDAARVNGRKWVGGRRTIRDLNVAPVEGELTEVLIRYHSDLAHVLEPSGAHTNRQPAREDGILQLSMRTALASWMTTEVVRL